MTIDHIIGNSVLKKKKARMKIKTMLLGLLACLAFACGAQDDTNIDDNADDVVGQLEQDITVRNGYGINDHGVGLKPGCNTSSPSAANNCFFPVSKTISIYTPAGQIPGLSINESDSWRNATQSLITDLNLIASGSGFTFSATTAFAGATLRLAFVNGEGAVAGSGMPRYAALTCSSATTITESIPGTYKICNTWLATIYLHNTFTDFGAPGGTSWKKHAQHVGGFLAVLAAGIGDSFSVGNNWNADNTVNGTIYAGLTPQAKACLTSYNTAGGASSLITSNSCL